MTAPRDLADAQARLDTTETALAGPEQKALAS